MSDRPLTRSRSAARRRRRAAALVPLTLLSGSWTASLATSGTDSAAETPDGLPQGISVPTEAIELPASVSTPGRVAAAVPTRRAGDIVTASSTRGIPTAALGAYQRAAQVINATDSHCNLDWPLVAAIGRVESDHGRYAGSVLSLDGVSRPGIFGLPLDGTNGTRRIRDTDAGLYDKDPVYDRAVGPMQFIPTTWSVVGVDADGDGRRNPQDIDDAALAGAVYLCSGREDLSSHSGQSAAIFRYNHSHAYVRLVKSIARAYAAGDYAATVTNLYAPVQLSAAHGGSVAPHAGGSGPIKAGGDSVGGTTAQPSPPQGSNPPGGPADEPATTRNPAVSVVTKTVTVVQSGLVSLLTPTPIGGLVRGLLGEVTDQ